MKARQLLNLDARLQVVVNAKKNKGASVGNKLKIDPVMMAMMEERIRQRVEEEKRKLAGPSPEEIRELEEYRRKFAELDEAKKNLVRLCGTEIFCIAFTFPSCSLCVV